MRLQPALALLAVPALLLSLAACGPAAPGEPDTVGTDAPAGCTPSGPISDSIKVTGDFGTQPETTVQAPISVPTLQRTVLIEGDGDEIQDGAQVDIHLTIYSGQTGDEVYSTGYEADGVIPVTVSDATIAGLVGTLRCATIGSRIVSAAPPADAFGDTGNEQLGVGPGETVVFVVDVVGVVKPFEPNWTSDVPKVEFGADGTPTVTMMGDAPTELKLAVLEEGEGDVVTAADAPQLDYQGTSWQTGEIFDQSYGKKPINLPATQYVPGFSQAIIGRTVGSTLLVAIPAELAYGPTASDDNPLGGQDLLFVIQIRAIK